MRRLMHITLIGLLIVTLAACGGKTEQEGKVVVSGKKFTEQIILANIIGEHLKANTDLDVVMEDSLGSTFVLQKAMEKGDIDLYVEYTGTAFENVLEEEFDPDMSTDEIYDVAKTRYEEEYNFTWSEPLGFNNTYTLVMNDQLYDELGITTFSELVDHSSDLVFAGTPEFYEREDGYDALVEAYGLDDFAEKVTLDPDLMYQAVQDGEVDIITAFSTEARIDQFDLKTLEDDKEFFPPYDAGIVIRQEVLDANPELEDALNELASLLDDERMRELNGRVNIDGKKDEDVAIEFLQEEGLLE